MPNNTIPQKLFDFATTQADLDFYTRLQNFSNFLLGTPYGGPEDTPLPEFTEVKQLRKHLAYNHEFTYSFDKLDCVTYLETTLALAYIKPEFFDSEEQFKEQFEQNLKSIRYVDGLDTYVFRNHITSLDWCNNNQHILRDKTHTVDPAQDKRYAHAEVNKSLFYYKTQIEKKFPDASTETWSKNLTNFIPSFEATSVDFPYLGITDFLANYAKVLENFPTTSAVQIVRPGWDLTNAIGTQLNVSHQGLVFKTMDENGNADLRFLHATSVAPKQVVNVRLYDYLKQYEHSPTIKGINIQKIRKEKNMEEQLQVQQEHKANPGVYPRKFLRP
jgi:hypothetical protein